VSGGFCRRPVSTCPQPFLSNAHAPLTDARTASPNLVCNVLLFAVVGGDDAGQGELRDLFVNCSGKFVLLDKLLPHLKAEGHRVLIFSQMVRILDLLSEFLRMRRFQHERLDGSIRGAERQVSAAVECVCVVRRVYLSCVCVVCVCLGPTGRGASCGPCPWASSSPCGYLTLCPYVILTPPCPVSLCPCFSSSFPL
jgi:hypothetical protein